MLQSINGTVKNWIILPLFTLLILSFVAWGIADAFRDHSKQKTVITAGAAKFEAQQVQAEVQRNLDYLRRVTGAAITADMADQLGIIDRSIDNLVTRALLDQESRRLGLVVSDSLIVQGIRAIPEFKKADGTFDADKFRKALANIGASEAAFMAEQRGAMARGKVQDIVTVGARPAALLEQALAAATQERRTFETYQVKYAAQPAPPAPDDATLEKYIADNTARFSTPETRTISLLRLTPAVIGKSIAISDEQVQQYYTEHADEFATPELRTFQQVVAATKDEADAAAKDFSTAKNPTTLPDVRPADLPAELQQPAFALAAGATSAPVQSPLGWHVLRLMKITPPRTTSLADATATIRTKLQADAAASRLYDESARLDDLLAAGTPLEDIAKEMDAPVEKIENLNADSPVPAVLEKQPTAVLREAFKLAEGVQSNVISMGEEGYAVVRVDKVTPAAVKPFAAVRAAALAAWQHDEQQKTAQERAIKLMADLRAGKTMADVAANYGATATREAPVTQDDLGAIKYLPTALANDLFTLKNGDVTQAPNDDAIVVVRLADTTLPVTPANAKADAMARKDLTDGLQKEMLEAYLNGLKQRYAVTIDRPAIRKLFAASGGEE